MSSYGDWENSLKEGKNPCIKCQEKGNDKSGDNFHYYGEGKGGYCNACEHVILSDEYKRGTKKESKIKSKVSLKSTRIKKEDKMSRNKNIEYNLSDWKLERKELTHDPSGYRGLTKNICKQFDVMHEYCTKTGELLWQVYPLTEQFSFANIKKRDVQNKKFLFKKGATGNTLDLFGQFYYRNSNSKDVIIVGGELDVLSAALMFHNRNKKNYEAIPVVSPTNGETGAYKQLQNNYDWLDRFDRIILCFDNDDAGRQATEKAIKVLPRGKVYLMSMTLKDPNEYLEQGEERLFYNAYWNVKKYVPSGIVGSSGLRDRIMEYIKIPKIPLPPFMCKLQKLMAGGIPLGVIVAMGSASGTGKTTIVDEISYYWYFNSPHKLGVITLENDSAQYGINLLSRHVSNKINLIESEEDKVEFLNRPEVIEASNELFMDEDGNNRFYLMEERDGSIETIMDLTENLIISCECKVIVFDPVSDVLEGCTNEEQQLFYKWMKSMTKEYLVTFVLISHLRKNSSGTKANSTGAEVHEEDFFGSSSIFKSSACNLLFSRNKESEDEIERNTTKMKATKIRWTGKTSPVAGEYFYDNSTHTMFDKEGYMKKQEIKEKSNKPKKFTLKKNER